MYDRITSNGNGNKSNMRIATLENLLKATEATGASARVNSLKQVIRRNKTDMAQDAKGSLDLMRVIFQNEITREIWQILDRHARTTFSPAIENLRRNGHVVDEEVMSDLFTNILESAKVAFTYEKPGTAESGQPPPPQEDYHPPQHPNMTEIEALRMNHHQQQQQQQQQHQYHLQQQQHLPQHHPHHQHQQLPLHPHHQPYPQHMREMDSPRNYYDVNKWSPERFVMHTLYISAAKVSQHMGQTLTGFFSAFPSIFRYVCDDHDRRVLADEGRLREDIPQIYLLNLDDVREITANVQELEPYAFCVKEPLVFKIRRYSQIYFEKLLHRKQMQQAQHQQHHPHQQQQQQQQHHWPHYEHQHQPPQMHPQRL